MTTQSVLPFAICCSLLAITSSAQSSSSTSGGTFLNGDIVTRYDVQKFADLSLDVRDMKTYGNKRDKQHLEALYEKGMYAENSPGVAFPLKYLSDYFSQTDAILTPNYLYHIYGLTSDKSPTQTSLKTRMAVQKQYQLTSIRKVIQSHPELTADAVLSLSIWMYATHLLYRAVDHCQKRTLASNVNVVPAVTGFDEFIALWIGTGQTAGTSNGNGLYAWTQEVGDYFQTNSPEAPANTNIILLYHEAATALALNTACTSNNVNTVQTLWNVATQIITEMMKPLFQRFLYTLLTENTDAADIYAKALLPQLVRCRPSLYNRLAETLKTGVQLQNKDEILSDIQEAYSCFGISCSDIISNVAPNNSNLKCENATNNLADNTSPALAGYRATTAVAPVRMHVDGMIEMPNSDNIVAWTDTHTNQFLSARNNTQLSRIDLDIRQMRILSSMEAILFTDFTYTFGSNVPKPRNSENDPFELLTLHELAVSAARSEADPIYTSFVKYYNDKNYADSSIRQILNGQSKWTTTAQRTEALALTSAFQIVYMEAIRQLYDSVAKCRAADPTLGFILDSGADRNPLDNAAALLIGSMEGTQTGGSLLQDGELVWHLGNKRAFQFQTMNDLGYATVNQNIIDLLYAGNGELDGVACTKLQTTVDQIVGLMQVSIIQSVLMAAVQSQNLDSTSGDLSLVQGEVFADSILPLISAEDEATANLIQENMVIKKGVHTVRDGAQAVADGFGYYVTNGANIPCNYLGSTSAVNPCAKYGTSGISGFKFALADWTTAGVWVAAASVTLLL